MLCLSVADDARSTERVDLVENAFVAFVMAENVSEAMAAGQLQAAESGLGPDEPIDWGRRVHGQRTSSQHQR
jgi:hypothetical protein